MHEWINLTTRTGETISNPTIEQLKNALEELLTSHDEEHPDAWIDCGSDNGPLYNISVYSSGYAIYTKYSDADMTEELATEEIQNLDVDKALRLWVNLINNKQQDVGYR